jgi:hypothetical protein
MKKIITCFQIILFIPAIAMAAQVFGSLKFEDRSVGPGVQLRIRCDGEKEQWVKTDNFGSYNMFSRAKRCNMDVNFRNQWSEPILIYPDQTDPVRYDFELVRRPNNTLFLRRK